MSRRRFEPTWPFVCILVCLFVLCAVSPSVWGTMLKRRATLVADGMAIAAARSQAQRQPVAGSDTAASTSTAVSTRDGVAANSVPSREPVPADPAVAMQTAPIAPAVAGHPADTQKNAATPENPATEPAAAPADTPVTKPAENPTESAAAPAVAATAAPAATTPTPASVAAARPDDGPSPPQSPAESSVGATQQANAKAVAPSPANNVTSREAERPLAAQPESKPPAAAQPSVSSDSPMPSPSATDTATSDRPIGPGPVSAYDAPPAKVAMRPRDSQSSSVDNLDAMRDLLLPQEPLSSSRSSPEGVDRSATPRGAAGHTPPSRPTPIPTKPCVPAPAALAESLRGLSRAALTQRWAAQAQDAIARVAQGLDASPRAAKSAIEETVRLCEDARRLEPRIDDPALAGLLARTAHGLERRAAVWRYIAAAGGASAAVVQPQRNDPRRLLACVDALDPLTREGDVGRSWANYLALDTLRQMSEGAAASNASDAARRILDRLTVNPVGREQRRFLASEPVAALTNELRRWSGRDVIGMEMLQCLERYEATQSPADAKALADIGRTLAASSQRDNAELAGQLESYYRNANVRLVVSRELLNRLVPPRAPEHDCVNDVVLGAPVHGQRTTTAKVAVRLIPDPKRIRLALEVTGDVSAATASKAGAATFYNRSESTYKAWKEIELGPEGLSIKPAEAAVDNDTALDDVETHFDRIPLFGALAQEVARSQHAQRRDEMNSEVSDRVYQQAKEQIDSEADERVGQFAKRIQVSVLDPLENLAVGPAVIGMETSDRRVTLRMRIASEGQLGAHTPRLRAPAESVASLQLHQSALNNLLEQMQLEGATFRVPELRKRLASRAGLATPAPASEENEDIAVTFAARNAVQVACENGRLSITLSLARLQRDGQHWDNFRVRAFYRPEVHQRTAQLVRDEAIQLLGEGLSTRAQIPLRGIFGRVFAKDRPLSLLPAGVATDARLAGIVVSQFEVQHGWIAVALAEDRPDRPAVTAVRRGGN